MQSLHGIEDEAEIYTQQSEVQRQVREEKLQVHKSMLNSAQNQLNPAMKRSLDIASQKGSSIWLNTLPIKSLGYYLNKQEFQDAIALRYNMKIQGMASYCSCGKQNSVDHALVCRLGGYTIMRHNEVRDVEANLLKEVCRDVQTEPGLIPLTGQMFQRSANHQDSARLDISARGLWGPMEKAFFDVRIFHPNADSNRSKSLPELYNTHEAEKKRSYNQRIIQVEHGTFTPLVFSTGGGEGLECKRYHKRLATLLSSRRQEAYADTISYIRRRIRFCILRTTLIAIRGFRKPKIIPSDLTPLIDVDISVAESIHQR